MLGMPVLGWLVLGAKGRPVSILGLPLPTLIGGQTLSKSLKEIHETIGTLGYYLIGLHAAAALFHHYLMRDNTLLRMLPARRWNVWPCAASAVAPPTLGAEVGRRE
jgi:cytochrome b561